MKRSNRTGILILAGLILSAAAAFYAYRAFNRKKDPVADLKAEYRLTAADLIRDFSSDEAKATGKYAGKVMEVEGSMKEAVTDAAGSRTVVIGDGASSTSLRFSMDSSFRFDPSGLAPQARIRLKGVCTGYVADELGLGADIIFNRGIIADPVAKGSNIK